MKYDIISNLKSIVKNKRRNMQYFGEIQTKYEEVFLTQSYMYFKKDEDVKLFCLTWHSPPCIMMNVMVMLCL